MSVSSPAVRAAAIGLVSVAAALAFGRVFADGGFVGLLLVAAIVPHVAGWVGRVRRWPLLPTALLGGATTLLALIWITAGETTAYGIPTPATLTRVGHLLDHGWAVFRTGVAPVPPMPGVVLLSALAVAVVAIAADTISRRPDVTIAALGPTLVLFVLTGTLGTDPLRVPATIAYVAASLVALTIANAARVESRRTWFTGRRLTSDASVVRSAAAIGGAALLLGLVITPLVPGVDSAALLKYHNGAGNRTAGLGDYEGVSPLVDLRARLAERSNIELFRVSSPVALYWRLIALDRFDGDTWSLSSEAKDAADVFGNRTPRGTVRQQFTITSLADQWLPAAFRPVATTVGNARAIPESGTLIAPTAVLGLSYTINSVVERAPTATQIAATARPLPGARQPDIELPDAFPAARRRQALDITRDAATPWDKAVALQQFFTDGSFAYDLDVPPGDGPSAIDDFLDRRRGFCQQFAAAYAALARAAGLPSRVVVGFTPGTYDATTAEYVVRGRDAHAWVEVWFAGLGWRTFEPTPAGLAPGQADPRGTGATTPGRATNSSSTTTTTAPTSATTGGNGASSSARGFRDPGSLISAGGSAGDGGWSARTVATLVLLVLLAVGAVGFAVRRLVRPGRLRRRRRHAPLPATQITGAWQDALDACRGAGLPVSGALTPSEQVRALAGHGAPGDAVPPLDELATLHAELEYSDHAAEPGDSERAWHAADEVRDALLVGVGTGERVRRALRTPNAGAPVDA
jgi:transglutaminase-like putative cysteine protease